MSDGESSPFHGDLGRDMVVQPETGQDHGAVIIQELLCLLKYLEPPAGGVTGNGQSGVFKKGKVVSAFQE